MTAATKDRDTQAMAGALRALPVAANIKGWAGTIACADASGNMTKGITATTLKALGVFDRAFDNTGGAAGAFMVEAKRGVYGPFANSASGDQIANADIGADCYIVDDSTVAKTSGSNTRSVAGKVYLVDAAGVWVDFR